MMFNFSYFRYTFITLSVRVNVRYYGKASHASAFPWDGVNALDAAVMAYSGIAALRQHFKPTWRAHGMISRVLIYTNKKVKDILKFSRCFEQVHEELIFSSA